MAIMAQIQQEVVVAATAVMVATVVMVVAVAVEDMA